MRETWQALEIGTDGLRYPVNGQAHDGHAIVYRADDDCAEDRWRSSIHMPRWASRELLELVEVRAEIQQEPDDEIPKAGLWVWVLRFRRVT